MKSWIAIVIVAAACGGANLNQRQAGNRAGGIRVQDHEIAVDPTGDHVVVRVGDAILVGDVASRTLAPIEEVAAPRLIAFWKGSTKAGSGMFVLTERELVSYDLAAARVVWRTPVTVPVSRLDVATDRAILAGGANVLMIDAATGADAGRFAVGGRGLEDLDVTPDGDRVIVTERERWNSEQPETSIHVLAAATAEPLCTAVVPNCADELVVDAEGTRAYLAPTTCRKDPVSIVDITASCKFEQNLPGFGPVALASDGKTGVAFLDRDARDPSAPPLPPGVAGSSDRFHLMMFDTHTHALRTVPIGNALPRYALTPDGKTLVVDALQDAGTRSEAKNRTTFSLVPKPVRLVDVATGEIRTATGPSVMLDAFVLMPDSSAVWLLHHDAFRVDRLRTPCGSAARPGEAGACDRKKAERIEIGLYRLDIAAATVDRITVPIEIRALNALPGAQTLLLRDELGVHVFDPAGRRITGTFVPSKRVQDARAAAR